MDPNAALKDLLDFARHVLTTEDRPDDTEFLHAAELLLALDEWLAGGGFLPERWGYGILGMPR